MNTGEMLMVAILVIVLVFGFVMDGYAVFLRIAGAEGLAESLAMANLVQYIARISNVVVIFVLSFSFETGRLTTHVAFIFLLAAFFGLISTLGLIHSKPFCNFVTACLRPLLHFSFRNISSKPVWQELGSYRGGFQKLTAISTLTNSLIVMAMFVPFGIAAYYPEMRMTSVYFGQLINFLATLLVFAIQDPVSMRMIDSGVLGSVGVALLYGRVCSYLVVVVLFALILFL